MSKLKKCNEEIEKLNWIYTKTNTETGEILDAPTAIELSENQIINTKKQIDNYIKINKRNESQKEVLNNFGEFLFVKVKSEMVSFMKKKIPEQYIPRIFVLGTYADEDGYLIDNNKLLRQQDILKILNISRQTFITMSKELEKKGIMKKVDGKYYQLSQTYFVRGQLPKIPNKTRYIKVFTNAIREIYLNLNLSKITHYKAFVMAIYLLPFLERNTCIPKHSNGDTVTVRDLLKMVDIDSEKYWRQINYIKHLKLANGEQLIKFITNSFDKESALNASMVINPKVFYVGDSEMMTEIDFDFNKIPNN